MDFMVPDVRSGCVMKPRPWGMRDVQRAALAVEGGCVKEVFRWNVRWIECAEGNGAVIAG